MAPFLPGRHGEQKCDRCGYSFCFGIANIQPNLAETVACPNCGLKMPANFQIHQGPEVVLQPTDRFERWDIVAIQQHKKIVTKRIVGLPGEKIDIVDGNVTINGRPITKPTAVQRQVSIPVVDWNYATVDIPTGDHPARTDGANEKLREPWGKRRLQTNHQGRWQFQTSSVTHRKTETQPNGHPFDFLIYQPITFGLQAAPVCITDSYGFNQRITRNLNCVDELAVRMEVGLPQAGRLMVRRAIGQDVYQFLFTRSVLRLVSIQETKEFKLHPPLPADETFEVLISNFDQNWEVAVNGKLVFSQAQGDPIVRQRSPAQSEKVSNPQVQIGFDCQSQGRLKSLRIDRDIYYQKLDRGSSWSYPVILGAGEYFVLGDNVPVSRDSRHFGPVKRLLGIVQRTN